jgi:hypothetical protein
MACPKGHKRSVEDRLAKSAKASELARLKKGADPVADLKKAVEDSKQKS